MALCAVTVVFVVLYSCVISFFFLRTETKSLKRSLWSNFNLNLKRSFCSLPSSVLLSEKSLLFSWTRIP